VQRIWANAQHNWTNVHAFDEFRSHLVTVGRIDQMRRTFWQTRSAIGQMRTYLMNFIRILSLLVRLTKCAAHLDKRAAQLVKCAHAFDEFRSHLVTVGRIDQMCSAFEQTRSAIGQMRTHLNWPNAHAFNEFCLNLITVGRIDQMRSAFGQMRTQFTKHCAFGQIRCAFAQMRRLVKCALQ